MLYEEAQRRIKQSRAKTEEYLLANFRNGGWGYHLGNQPATEATAWCAISLRDGPTYIKDQVNQFLLENQNSDGGWSTGPKIGNSDWSSGPAILALRLLNTRDKTQVVGERIEKALSKAFIYLFDSRIDFYGPTARFVLFLWKGQEGLSYGRGWPWTPGCFNWIEPTSYNLLALRVPSLPSAGVYREVVEHANKFFIEHACAEGGWNHGSERALGVNLPPYTVTTAEALLVLQDHKEHPAVTKGLAFLDSVSDAHPSAMSLAWAILARSVHGEKPTKEVEALLNSQNGDGSFGSNFMVTGLASTALSTFAGDNPFIFSELIN
jgi:Prenyltransferase and squalene oxidase repeat